MDNQELIAKSLKQVFDSVDQYAIKKGVDEMGIDKFISHCAGLAAGTGVANGIGGFATMIVGVPVDVVNNIFQQFRVTLAVIYHKKGVYQVSFTDFIKIVGISLGVEAGATVTQAILINIAGKILARLSASTAGKAIPLVGGLIVGSVNYGFIHFIGKSVQEIDMSDWTFETDS
jgi:hypothetical protein